MATENVSRKELETYLKTSLVSYWLKNIVFATAISFGLFLGIFLVLMVIAVIQNPQLFVWDEWTAYYLMWAFVVILSISLIFGCGGVIIDYKGEKKRARKERGKPQTTREWELTKQDIKDELGHPIVFWIQGLFITVPLFFLGFGLLTVIIASCFYVFGRFTLHEVTVMRIVIFLCGILYLAVLTAIWFLHSMLYNAKWGLREKKFEEVMERNKKLREAWLDDVREEIVNHIRTGGDVHVDQTSTRILFSGKQPLEIKYYNGDWFERVIASAKSEKRKFDAEQERIAKEKEEAERKQGEELLKARWEMFEFLEQRIRSAIQEGLDEEEALNNVVNVVENKNLNLSFYQVKISYLVFRQSHFRHFPFFLDQLDYFRLKQYAHEEKQKYDVEQEAIRKQKEAEEKRKQEAWDKAERLMREEVQNGRSIKQALDNVIAQVHIHLPLDVGKVWRQKLQEIGREEERIIEERRAAYEREQAARIKAENRRKYDAAVQAHREELARTRSTHVPYRGRTEEAFLARCVHGHVGFRESFKDVLDLVEKYAPHRGKEILEYLPQAVFVANLRGSSGREVAGLSGGEFSQDGKGKESTYLKIWQENSLKSFMKTVIHETGHNVLDNRNLPNSERDTDLYAKQVLQEMIWGGFEAKITDFYFGYLKEDLLPPCRFEYVAA